MRPLGITAARPNYNRKGIDRGVIARLSPFDPRTSADDRERKRLVMERWQSVAADHDRTAQRRCQIAKGRGAWVVGTTSSPEKARLARDAGADEVISVRYRAS